MDAATGGQDWKSLVGPATSAGVVGAYFNYASPTVANGLVYDGVSASCNHPFVRGGVQSFSQQTGSLQHSFWTVPAGQVGASVWSSEAATKGWVWVTTGDPEFTGTQLYHAYSVLRLNSSTLALSGSWQLKLPQAADPGFRQLAGALPRHRARVPTPLVAACNKNGRCYALPRDAWAAGRSGPCGSPRRITERAWRHRFGTPRPVSCTCRAPPRASAGEPITDPSAR